MSTTIELPGLRALRGIPTALSVRMPVAAPHVRVLSAIGLGWLGMTIAWLRLPAAARDTFWAEDGRTFVEGALTHPLAAALVTPYDGYLHTLPRLMAAAVVALLPAGAYAIGITLASCAVAGAVVALIFLFTANIVPSPWWRAALALVTVAAPTLPREVLGNAANVHTLCLWLAMWLLVGRTDDVRLRWIGAGAALLAATTEVQTLLLLPLALLAARSTARRPIVLGIVAGATVQSFAMLVDPRRFNGNAPVSVASMLDGYLMNGSTTIWVPQSALGHALEAGWPLIGIASILPAVAAIAFVWHRGTGIQRAAVAAVPLAGIAVWTASLIANPQSFYDYASLSGASLERIWLTRYGIVPQLTLISVMIIGLSLAARIPVVDGRGILRSRRPALIRVATVLVAGVVLVAGNLTPTVSRRAYGPQWEPQTVTASRSCAAAPDDAVRDLGETLGWTVQLTCDQLEDDPGSS
ncbi:hypothetical protein HII28_16290 [Planctomonas sp. JC2975]|uniref:hypothetical protein n=1 Tax=Planctomonas sp. JC2975 TaxID=2729626 RepID=UPI001474A37F|nr:hypothetical protein [Planctomonas sp. JC2975]NNC13430.1 hypothetical protein [Planctomonas sp. JC2975]